MPFAVALPALRRLARACEHALRRLARACERALRRSARARARALRLAPFALALAGACQPEQAPLAHDAAPIAAANTAILAAAPAPAPAPTVASLSPVKAATSAESPLTEEELAFFDRLVSDEILFPRPAERARYERQEPETIKNQLHVGFELKQQPGMKKGRHFHLVDVAVARAGTYVTRRKEPKMKGSAGPNGSSIEFAAQTPDGAYDIRVSQGMLLVRPVKAPEFDPERVATALVTRYATLRADASRAKTN